MERVPPLWANLSIRAGEIKKVAAGTVGNARVVPAYI